MFFGRTVNGQTIALKTFRFPTTTFNSIGNIFYRIPTYVIGISHVLLLSIVTVVE